MLRPGFRPAMIATVDLPAERGAGAEPQLAALDVQVILSRALKALKFLLTLRISILMVHSSALLFGQDMRDSLHCLSRRMTNAISSNRLATLRRRHGCIRYRGSRLAAAGCW